MIPTAETDGQTAENRVNLAQIAFVEKLHEFNAIQKSISDDSGQVMTLLDQMEQHIDSQSERIKRIRNGIKEKMRHSRRLERELSDTQTRLFGEDDQTR